MSLGAWVIGITIFIVVVLAISLAVYFSFFRCVANKAGGTVCTKDCECIATGGSGKCGLESGDANAQMVCCSVGSVTIGGKVYCTGLPDGKTCLSPTMCATSLCTASSTAPGVCGSGSTGPSTPGGGVVPPPPPPPTPAPGSLPRGAVCTSNNECANRACARPNADTDAQICCFGDSTDLFDFRLYCTGMPAGSSCRSDAMCASGNCRGNLGGIQKGVCD